MNEKQKKECRKCATRVIKILSDMLEEDFEPTLYGVFRSKKDSLSNSADCCGYSLRDLTEIIKSIEEKNELDKAI
jgi:hypothetical protein